MIILAAGRGTRMGGPKALMHVDGREWWRAQDAALAALSLRRIWVVSRAVAPALPAAHPDREVVLADELAPMFASIAAGLCAIAPSPPRGIFILPVDVPVPGAGVWAALRQRGQVCVPTHGPCRGHPLWMDWSFVEAALLPRIADPVSRLDELTRAACVAVETGDESVLLNLNTPADVVAYERRLAGEA